MTRVVVDTNVLLSSLISRVSPSAEIMSLWERRRFALLTTSQQLEELSRVTRYGRVRDLLRPALAGRLINRLRDSAILLDTLPPVDTSPDPDDNYLLALAEAGQARFLVTGDKPLLELRRHKATPIITPAVFVAILKRG